MIKFSFSLRNPFTQLFKTKVLVNTLVTEYKSLEIEYNRNNEIIGWWLNWSTRHSHAGISFGFSFLSFGIYIALEDIRHWNYDNNCWGKHEDEINGC